MPLGVAGVGGSLSLWVLQVLVSLIGSLSVLQVLVALKVLVALITPSLSVAACVAGAGD